MLASTIVYFVIPLLVVIILYSRLVWFSKFEIINQEIKKFSQLCQCLHVMLACSEATCSFQPMLFFTELVTHCTRVNLETKQETVFRTGGGQN